MIGLWLCHPNNADAGFLGYLRFVGLSLSPKKLKCFRSNKHLIKPKSKAGEGLTKKRAGSMAGMPV